MDEFLKKTGAQIRDFMNGLSLGKKVGIVLTVLLIIGAVAGIFYWAGRTNYVPLMTGLNPEDATAIIRLLREKQIPFKVDPSGKTISVPAESLYEFRLEVATLGLPQTGTVGYEVFDKQSLGTTTLVQKMNQKRALEGELVRTINTIKGVRRSRVHLAIPPKSAFIEDQKKPTASVVVDLNPGTVLSEKQVYGIGNLVARAVEGLDLSEVVIVDAEGKLLSKTASDALAGTTATQLEFQERLESDLEKRIETVLARVVGDGHVVAKVTADLDFAQVNETETVYDQDGSAVRSVEKRNDLMNGSRPGPYGVPGNIANTPGLPPTQNQAGYAISKTTKMNEVTNYEVPQTVRKTTRALGNIKRLSVAVLVDGKISKIVGKDGVITTKSENWSEEKIKEFEDIAAGAVGLDRKRGDVLQIKNMEFNHEDLDEAQKVIIEADHRTQLENALMYAGAAAVILLFFLFVIRPVIKWITEGTSENVDAFLPQTIEELERFQKSTAFAGIEQLEEAVPVIPENIDPDKVKSEMIKEKVVSLIEANPHKAALILKDWLHGEGTKKRSAENKDGKEESQQEVRARATA